MYNTYMSEEIINVYVVFRMSLCNGFIPLTLYTAVIHNTLYGRGRLFPFTLIYIITLQVATM